MKPAQFELSSDVRFLRQKLHELKPGDTITYSDLGKTIGKEMHGAFPALQSAKRGLLREGYVFSAIRKQGIKRLTDAEVVLAADGDIASMRRRARLAGRKLSTVSYETLPPERQLAHTVKSSIVGAISVLATDKAMAKIEKAATGRAGELPIAETMKALGYGL